jgi:hypothetical protein
MSHAGGVAATSSLASYAGGSQLAKNLYYAQNSLNERNGLITSTMIHNCDKLGVLDNLD